jgi:hypothetical protein
MGPVQRATFLNVICEVAFLKICRLADAPLGRAGYYPRWLCNGVGVFIFSPPR